MIPVDLDVRIIAQVRPRGQPMPTMDRFCLPPVTPWHGDMAELTPLYQWSNWPCPAQLSRSLGNRAAICFSEETPVAEGYEVHIHRCGRVPTRSGNWHDLYNALIWSLFPASKRAMNHAHVAAMGESGGRGARRDALTQFDECGLLLVSASAEVFAELDSHQWQSLLWQRRPQWLAGSIRAYLFGHALYEALHQPFAGLCGKVMGVVVDADFGQLPLTERYQLLDAQLAQAITTGQVLNAPRRLAPLPLLGIPGAVAANAEPGYYCGDQFRPLRRPRPGFDCLDLRLPP